MSRSTVKALLCRAVPAVLLLLPGGPAGAGEPPAAPLTAVPAEEVDQLVALEGETRTVRGFVERTRTNAAGIHFLEFRDSSFVCVVFPRFLDRFPGGDPAAFYQEQHVAVTGALELYRGQPQIKLERAEQVQLLEAPAAPAPPPAEPAQPAPAAPGPEPKAEPEPQPATAASGRQLEVVDGKPALDWRLYFPE